MTLDFDSGESGSFEICGLPEGEVFVSASKEIEGTHFFISERPVLKRSEVRRITLMVRPPVSRPGGHLEIRLVLPDGSAGDVRFLENPRCYIHARSGDWKVELAQGGVQDEEGRWLLRVGRPSPGIYEALVTAGGYVGRIDRCEVQDGKTSRSNVDLVEAVKISGRLVDAATGRGLQGRVARELGYADSRPVSTHFEETGADGTFAVFLFAPGETGVLRVWSRGFEARTLTVTGRATDVGDVLLNPEGH